LCSAAHCANATSPHAAHRIASRAAQHTYEVIYIINFKTTLFKGFTRGGPCKPSRKKQNLNRTQKYKVIACKKNKKDFLRTLQGGALGWSFYEAKFKQDAK
jgi:hypothetical protein